MEMRGEVYLLIKGNEAENPHPVSLPVRIVNADGCVRIRAFCFLSKVTLQRVTHQLIRDFHGREWRTLEWVFTIEGCSMIHSRMFVL